VRSAVMGVILVAACGGRPQPRHTVLVCDHSTSSACEEASVRNAARAMLARPVPGSRFETLLVGCGSDDIARPLLLGVPARWGSGAAQKRRAWIEAEERHLENLRLGRRERCSGIVSALWQAARILKESNLPVKEIELNSDLREVSPETGFNLERSIPAPSAFVGKLREQGVLPNLANVDIVVCGVHDNASPDTKRWTARQSAALRAAWTAAFSAMGVRDVELGERCPWDEGGRGEIAAERGL